MKKQLLFLFAFLVFRVAYAQCPAPLDLIITNVTNTSAVLSWTDNNQPNTAQWQVLLLPAGVSPGPNDWGMAASTDPFVITNLECNNVYAAYVQSICNGTSLSAWSEPVFFETSCSPQSGWPIDLTQCSDNGQFCFDLTSNTNIVLGSLNPADYTVTYHLSQADAVAGINPVPTPSSYCTNGGLASTTIFIRLEENATATFEIFPFALTVQQTVPGNVLQSMAQCDENLDGTVIFDLTSAGAQINTSSSLSFYSNSLDANNATNAIANPAAYGLIATLSQSTNIFIREEVSEGCDIIYTLPIHALSNCNIASLCGSANPLCGALGIPFSNTVGMPNAETGNNYDCLMTQPNPTWFFIPISEAGTLTFQISQVSAGGNPIDVDFIGYGPFTDPTAACQGLQLSNVVGCSYSTAAVENFTIPNGVPGQFYLLMVTNFANQPGTITINQSGGTGDMDCSGIMLNAFLDLNTNGVKDSGEVNFALGQFHYEKNDSGDVHHITSPNGTYGIFDLNGSNTYDISFTVDPSYSANYNVTTSSYSNVSVVQGGGIQYYYFPVTAAQSYNDLAVTIIPDQAPRPGFTYTNTVRYFNFGNQVVSGTLSFNKDPLVTLVGTSQLGTVNNAAGFTYNFQNLQPFESRTIVVTMQVPVIPTVQLGGALTCSATIVPLTGDIVAENNTSTSTQLIIGSYDPNDKMESRGGQILITDFTPNDYLYYTVRFENSGTASAINVRILDVLDDKLDAASMRMVSASHPYILDRLDNVLTWRFDNIMLPASITNPSGAKGYIHFKIKPKPGYAIGDIINNTASIFFDFNPAIVTNTFSTQFVQALGRPSFENDMFSMYPNPAGDHVTVSLSQNSGNISSIAVYDILGKSILNYSATSSTFETIDISEISSGLYFVEITTNTNIKSIKKLMVK
jgi:uncharacterized repeat protein (TIGR01451 family)